MINDKVKSVFLITFLIVIAKMIGLGRNIVISSSFGTTAYTDAYFTAEGLISNLLFALSSAVAVAIVPIYLECKEREGIVASGQFFLETIIKVCIGMIGVVFLIVISAPVIVRIAAPGFSDEQFEKMIVFMRVISIGLIFSVSCKIIENVLNAEKKYGFASLTSIINSCIVIATVLLLSQKSGLLALAIAVPISFVVQFCILVYKTRRIIGKKNRISASFSKYLIILLKKSLPLMLSNATIEVNQLVDKMILSFFHVGVVTAISYANIIEDFAVCIVVIPICTVIFTELSEKSVKEEYEKAGHQFANAIDMLIYVSLPVTIIVIFGASDIVEFLFQHGAFNEKSTELTANVLSIIALSLIPTGLKTLYQKAFYSLKDTKTPMKVCIIEVFVNVGLSILMSLFLEEKGVLLATGIAAYFSVILFKSKIKQTFFGNSACQKKSKFIKVLIATLFMAITCYIVGTAMDQFGPVYSLAIKSAGSLLVYVFLSIALKCEELQVIINCVRRRKR